MNMEDNMNQKILVAVDLQNDFITGTLGSEEARKIIPYVVDKIKNWDGYIFVTRDTHDEQYLDTREGKHLPVKHCIENLPGHCINPDVKEALLKYNKNCYFLNKHTFGSTALPELIDNLIGETNIECIELIGLCTDVCVVSNAMLLKAKFPNLDIIVDASCCAGITPESHKAALTTMKMCQIDIIGE